MSQLQARIIIIDQSSAGQRLDNFLLKTLKGVPKSKVYKIIRKGEVRVNSGRVKALYKLVLGDKVRIPPIRLILRENGSSIVSDLILHVVYEDSELLIINKPAGVAVHAGSGNAFGVIDVLRGQRPGQYLELIHRIDKETTGLLLLAKSREVLLSLQKLWLANKVSKKYLLLVQGFWPKSLKSVNIPISPIRRGGRMFADKESGKPSLTKFQVVRYYRDHTLLFAWPITGRTHQIRVHASYQGFPLVGDIKYGASSGSYQDCLFLHASAVSVESQFDILCAQGVICPMSQKQREILKSLHLLDV